MDKTCICSNQAVPAPQVCFSEICCNVQIIRARVVFADLGTLSKATIKGCSLEPGIHPICVMQRLTE